MSARPRPDRSPAGRRDGVLGSASSRGARPADAPLARRTGMPHEEGMTMTQRTLTFARPLAAVARPLAALAATVLLAAGALAQAPAPQEKPEIGPDPLDGPTRMMAPPDQMQQELRELFRQVELRLREIDRLLSDASAGDTALLDDVGEAGIDKLLDRSRENATKSIQDIDRILEIAEQMGSQAQSSGGSCEKPGGQGTGQSPIDQAGTQRTQREATPDAPPEGAGEQAEKQGDQGEKPGEEKKPGGDTPRDGRASDDPFADNQEGAEPPGSERGSASDANGLDRWGDLPITVRDVFRTEGGGDLPPRYRDWIDSYYRRLSDRR